MTIKSYNLTLDNGTFLPLFGDHYFRRTLGIVSLTMGVFGIIFNLLTILSVGRLGSKIGKEVKIQLINLAVADMLAAAFVPAMDIFTLWPLDFPESDALCKTLRFVGYGALQTGPIWNMAIAIERVVIMYFPLTIRRYNIKHKLIVAACVWTAGFLPGIQSLLYGHVALRIGNDGDLLFCGRFTPRLSKQLHSWIFSALYFVPSIIIGISYMIICIKVCTKGRIGERGSIRQESRAAYRRTQVLRMLAVDAAITLISWLPYSLFFFTIPSDLWERWGYINSERAAKLLGAWRLTNVFSSPVIYFIFTKAFRADVKSLFKDPLCCGDRTITARNRASISSGPTSSASVSSNSNHTQNGARLSRLSKPTQQ